MSSADDASRQIDLGRRIDAACDAFEAEWLAGQRPELDAFLASVSLDERRFLLAELLPLDVAYRRRRGESPVPGDYAAYAPVCDPGWLEQVIAAPASPQGDDVTRGPDQPPATPMPLGTIRYFGDYELLEEVARGGMGVVYRARQRSLNRIVAIKQILAGASASTEAVERFVNEAQTAALLDHPNIVPLYEVGVHEGLHYLSMGFVEGRNLDSLIAHDLPDPREAARIMAIVSDAIQFAHEQGVVHRDLKPSNVLLDKAGSPRITDFGLAKRLDEQSGMTASGQVLGTPSYMPPEQAAGKIDAVGPRSDVYALGAILYVLLTGRPPFKAASALQTLNQVLEREPAGPRALNPNVPRDLETIALKCLEKSIAKRYETARDVGDELRRYLNGEPIRARPIGRIQRSWRWCRRNPLSAALVGLLLVSFVSGTAVSTWFGWQERQRAIAENQARVHEQLARQNAERQRDIAAGLNDLLTRDILGQADIWNQAETQQRVDPNITIRATLDRAAARVDERFHDQPDVEVAIRRALGAAFNALGDYAKGAEQLERALQRASATNEVDAYERLGAMFQLAKAYWQADRRDVAVAMMRSCLEETKVGVGLETREAINAQLSLAYMLIGKDQESLQLLEELRPIVARVYDPDDSDALHFQNVLGLAQQELGQMPAALTTFTAAHARAQAKFGERNPLTMMLLNNRARWYLLNHQAAEARSLFAELEPAVRSELGDENVFAVLTRSNLAYCYLATGDAAKAAEVLAEIVPILEKNIGRRHPQTRMSLATQARALALLGKPREAAAIYEDLLKLSALAPGPIEVMPPRLVWPVAQIYFEQRMSGPLVTLLRNYWSFLSSTTALSGPDMADELDEIGRYLLLADEPAGAEQALRKSLELRRRDEPDGWRRNLTQSQLGEIQIALGRLPDAESLLTDAYAGLQRNKSSIPATARPRTLAAIERMVRLYEQWDRAESLAEWLKKLDVARQATGVELP